MRYLWNIFMLHRLHFTHTYETQIRTNVKFISPIIYMTG